MLAPDIGFDCDRNEVTIVTPSEAIAVPEASKLEIAQKILEAALRIRRQQVAPVPASTRQSGLHLKGRALLRGDRSLSVLIILSE